MKAAMIRAFAKKIGSFGALVAIAVLVTSCSGESQPTASPAEKLPEREECSASALNSGAATLTGLPDDANRKSTIATVVVVDVSKATDVGERSLAARCFIRGSMMNSVKDRAEHDFYFVFLGKSAGQFPIQKLGGSSVGKARRAALATSLSSRAQAEQAVDAIWGEMLAGRVPTDIQQCGQVLAAALVGNGINDTELLNLVDSMCGSNLEITNILSTIAQAEAETEAGSDVYGTVRIIDNEFANKDLAILRMVMFSDLLDFNPSKDSNLAKELKGKSKDEASKDGAEKGLTEGAFQSRNVQILAEQPAETAGGTQRDIRQQVEVFWREYMKTRGASIEFYTNLVNA